MMPAFNFELKYRVTMLTREEWTRETGTPPVVEWLVWFTDGSKMKEGIGVEIYGQSVGRRLRISPGRYATVFQTEIYVILACAHKIQSHGRLDKHVSTCSDHQAALKTLQAVRTSPLIQQCQKALNDISAQHTVGLYWVTGHAGLRGNEIADQLARANSALKFVGPEPALGVSRQDIRRRIRRWLVNEHWVRWRGLGNTQRQARELISAPCLDAKARFLSFDWTQYRAITGLLAGHNTLRRHLHLMGLSDIPLSRRCGGEDETSEIYCM
jgi:hypothetical protein